MLRTSRGRHAAALATAAAIISTVTVRHRAAQEPAADGIAPFTFRDVTKDVGLLPHLAGIKAHAAGWGDADGDGRADLYVGTFADAGAGPNIGARPL